MASDKEIKKERLHWVDVAKGILIVMVAMVHITGRGEELGISCPAIDAIGPIAGVLCFRMPAFFILAGFWGKYDMGFKDFLIRNAKGLLLPLIIFSYLGGIIHEVSYEVLKGSYNAGALEWPFFGCISRLLVCFGSVFGQVCLLGGMPNQSQASCQVSDLFRDLYIGCTFARGVVFAQLRLLEVGADYVGLFAHRTMGESSAGQLESRGDCIGGVCCGMGFLLEARLGYPATLWRNELYQSGQCLAFVAALHCG